MQVIIVPSAVDKDKVGLIFTIATNLSLLLLSMSRKSSGVVRKKDTSN